MATSKAVPLCETCPHHEGQSSKVDFMWGAGWIAGGVILGIFTFVFALILGNSEGIQQTRKVVARNERMVNNSINKIDHTLTIISMNQIRLMKGLKVDYIDPKPMIFHEEEY